MTAVTHLAFRTHLHPEQVDYSIRRRMARELVHEQFAWSLLLAVTGFAFAVSMLFIFRTAGVPHDMGRDGVETVVLGTVGFLLFLEFHYRSQRKFVMSAPAATAVVVREKEPPHFDSETSLAVPRLFIRYVPGVLSDPEALHAHKGERTAWVELDGFSGRFERNVRPGDLITVLYDPEDRQHVRVVEMETGY